MSTKLLKPIDGVEKLSTDCWQLIFNYLNNDDLEAVSLVCKDFLAISNFVKKSLKVNRPEVDILSQHLKRFTQLKRIDFSEFRGDFEEAIRQVARSGLCLETLDTCPKTGFKNEGLIELGSNPNMKNLKVLNCYETVLQDNDLVVIANFFPLLEELNMRRDYELIEAKGPTDHGIETLASKLTLLKRFYIQGKHDLSDEAVVALSLNCVFLKDVTIHGSGSGITENGIGLLLRNRPNLELLSIGSIYKKQSSTITIENSISHAKCLTSLSFMHMDISDNLFLEISKAKLRLKNLELILCWNFTASGLLVVFSNYLTELCLLNNSYVEDMELVLNGDVGNLTHILISPCQLTKSTMFLLPTKCPSLVEIKIESFLPLHYGELIAIDDEVDDLNLCLDHCDNIRNLYLPCFVFSEQLLQLFVIRFSNLKVLNLSYCCQVTSPCLEAILKSCKLITELILEGYAQSMMIEANSELPDLNLEVLDLWGSSIVDEGLVVVGKKCPKLLHLDLRHCENVTIEGIRQTVQNIKTLTRLGMLDSENVIIVNSWNGCYPQASSPLSGDSLFAEG
ncbi:Leucine-rich repeat, cysteine-containing subtype [Corchorus olitorius]|uniref:Leucine-rich repeat, cysteine-containing subtype n=1 Tax=Corchorus olitorius TaxID=93759 RepID=A0A1R3IXC4_9ROSI|nr:Leucine-rich repeat, cysteine-containing subtype [Corchorus olitorius]